MRYDPKFRVSNALIIYTITTSSDFITNEVCDGNLLSVAQFESFSGLFKGEKIYPSFFYLTFGFVISLGLKVRINGFNLVFGTFVFHHAHKYFFLNRVSYPTRKYILLGFRLVLECNLCITSVL